MFRSMNSEQHFNPKGASRSPTTTAARLEGAKGTKHGSTDGSWMNVLSVVSRPALSLLQKYLPSWSQTPALATWDSEAGTSRFALESSLVAGLDKVPFLRCHDGNVAGAETVSRLDAESLGELGIRNAAITEVNESHAEHAGYLASARNSISHVVLNLASVNAETRRTAERAYQRCFAGPLATRSGNGEGYWGEEAPQNAQKRGREWELCEALYSGFHCHAEGSPAAVAKATGLRVHSDDTGSMREESAGASRSKESTDKGSLHMPRPESLPSSEQLSSAHQDNVVAHLVSTRAVAACSEVAVLTPDQDNGYSSLEEETANAKQHGMKLECEKQGSELESPANAQGSNGGNMGDGDKSEAVGTEEEERNEESPESAPVDEALPSTPHCQNKAIAYIMGSPCSDDSESEDDSDWDSDDDDGFDSEGSSHLSDSEDQDDSDDGEDEEDSDADEVDSESERLWNSLCQNEDPYNPRNFTAPLRTTTKSCPTILDVTPSGSPAEPSLSPFSSPLSSLSSLIPKEEEESSEEVCSMDEAECTKLWNSFSCSSDPYSPLNFQAPTRTREPTKGRCKKVAHALPPIYKKEEAEERLDSGFSEAAPVQGPGSGRCVRLKKVTFVEEVEEFYASSDEDRCSPWEAFARDRCRFQRRVQEVEETISYCLAPTFRLVMFQRLYHSS